MIKKLLKYDLKKMFKILIYIYVVSVVLASVTRLIKLGNSIQAINIIASFFEGLTYSAIVSILVNTFIHILKVFVNNFYKDESYLTHTLPVSKNKLYLSKYISALIVTLSSVAVCLLTLFILLYTKTFFAGIKVFIAYTVSGFNLPTGLILTLLILIIFMQVNAIITMAFMAVVKAYTYNEKRLLKGFLWFALYYFGGVLVLVLLAVVVCGIGGFLTELFSEVLSQRAFVTLIVLALVYYVALLPLYYFLGNKLFNKGVNVD